MIAKTRKLKLCFKLFTFYFLITSLLGCDAFVRKFTRKRDKEKIPQEEMVLTPEEYRPPAAQEQYRNFFLYWQSWQEELITALNSKASQKRQLSCAKEALKNLNNLRPLISAAKQKKLDIYIGDLAALKNDIERDTYGHSLDYNARAAERLKMRVLKEFNFSKVAGDTVSLPTEGTK